MVAHKCNPSTGETEAGEPLVGGQPGLHSKNLSQKERGEGEKQSDIYMTSYIFPLVPILQPGITLASAEASHSSYYSWCSSQPLPTPGTRTGKRHITLPKGPSWGS
jgi:hypothetical protein